MSTPILPQLEPATQAFLDSLAGAPPIQTLTPAAARQVLAQAQQAPVPALPEVDVKDVTLPVGPTGQTAIRVLRPAGAAAAAPCIVYMHGGGWVLGDRQTHDRLLRELAVGSGAVVVFVDYERAPEARYPVALEQGYAVARHIADNAERLRLDPGRIAIAGDSVGGNMATVIALLAQERQGPAFKAQLLFYPVTDAAMATPSYADFADGPWLTRAAMAWYWDQYLPDRAQRADPHVSPLNAAPGALAGLPPTLLIVDENDVLRDEGEAYGRRLAAAGVRVTSVRYNSTIHDFVMLNALAMTPAARGAIGQACVYLRNAFATA